VPRIAYFLGISIYLYLDDHGTPHCHAMYGDYAGSFSQQDGLLLAAQMLPKQHKKIQDFISSNQEELMEKWNDLSD